MNGFFRAVLATTVVAMPAMAEDVEWTTSISGGSVIEIPAFLEDGWVRALMIDGDDTGTAFEPENYPVQLRQYRTFSTGRPYDFLANALGANADEVTYRLDRKELGAISGYTTDRKTIFYGMCKKEDVVICFDMHWDKEAQGMFGPIAERIAKGFKDGLPTSRSSVGLDQSDDEIIDQYTAYIGKRDLFNSQGDRLSNPWQIIRQDRANYHLYHLRDSGDRGDEFFGDKQNRDALEAMLARGTISRTASDAIIGGDVWVEVEVRAGDGGLYIRVSVTS